MQNEIYFKALKAAFHFSDDELIDLINVYGGLRHLRDALRMKDSDKNVRVYVASGYDVLLNDGYELKDVLNVANFAKEQARLFFSSNFSFFVPVLEFGRLKISRSEAMKLCFKELVKSTFLFIADTHKVCESEGIYDEYKFAKKNKIGVIFQNHETRKAFVKRFNDEKSSIR